MTTEGERIIRLETKIDNIEQKVDDGFEVAKEEMKKLNTKMDLFIEAAEKRFASKWVENALKWGITLVIAAVLTAILALVIKR